MASESSRKTSVRRLTKPDDTSIYIDGPVIDVISFIDAHDSYQETEHTFDNTISNTSRKTHKVTVTGIDDPSSTIDVERIDSYDATDAGDRGQETITALLNSDTPPKHLQTHTIKVFAKDDTGTWYKVQRVDRFSVIDPRSQYQETVFQLKWDDGSSASDDGEGNTDIDNTENSAYDSGLDPPDTSSDGSSINPPWRFDPFQNIVDVNWGVYLMVVYDGGKIAAIPMSDIAEPHAIYNNTTGGGDPGEWLVNQTKPQTGVSFNAPATFTAFEETRGTGFGSRATLSTNPFPPFSTDQATFGYSITSSTTSGALGSDIAGYPDIGAPPYTGTTVSVENPGAALDSLGGYSTIPAETITQFGASQVFVHTDTLPTKIVVEAKTTITGGGSMPVARLEFSQAGGFDVFTTKTSLLTSATTASIDNISIHYVGRSDLDANPVSYSGTTHLSYLDVDISLPWSGPSDFGTNVSYIFHQFPYWPKGKYFAEITTTPPYPAAPSYQVVTPWGTFTGRWYRDWIHASNGKHVIQGVLIGNDSKSAVTKKLLYLDGSDYGDVLAAAVGTTLSKIQAVYMDKKLSEIKDF
jgi:hypothetical protein